MRTVTATLYKDTVEYLERIGSIQQCLDILVQAADDGLIDLVDKPPVHRHGSMRKYDLIVDNENYEQMLEEHGAKSTIVSVSRLLTWAVDTEVFAVLPETYFDNVRDNNDVKIAMLKAQVTRTLCKLYDISRDDKLLQFVEQWGEYLDEE